MSVHTFQELYAHVGHDVEVSVYVREGEAINVAVECVECYQVLLDFDKYPE